MKRKFSMEDLKDIVILMMLAKSAREGWLFVASLAQCRQCLFSLSGSLD